SNVQVNTVSPPQTATLTNNTASPLTFSNISVSGQFVQTNDCPASLGPGAFCTFTITFKPLSNGNKTGSVNVSYGTGSLQLYLYGSTPQITVTLNPATLNFGNQQVGVASSPQNILLTNGSSNVLTISS